MSSFIVSFIFPSLTDSIIVNHNKSLLSIVFTPSAIERKEDNQLGVWCRVSLTPELGGQRQANLCGFEASLAYNYQLRCQKATEK